MMGTLDARFAAGLQRGKLEFQRCRRCGLGQLCRRRLCANCASDELDWFEMAGRGCVWAATTVARAPDEGFRALVPYRLVLVDMDEGPRLMGHAAADAGIGDRVVATLFDHAGRRLLKFRRDEMGAPP